MRCRGRKLGRIENDHVETLARLAQLAQCGKHIGLAPLGAAGVKLRIHRQIGRRRHQRRTGGINRQRRTRPTRQRLQRKAAGVAKTVEHPPSRRQLTGQAAVVALVKVEAGLVAADHVHRHAHAVFNNRQICRQLAVHTAGHRLQPLTATHVGVGALVHRLTTRRLHQRRHDRIAPLVSARAGQLHHHHRAVTIHHHARQAVGLAMDQA